MNLFQVDAFTDRLFGGNPAAVIPLERWWPDAVLQQVAAENNLSETAYFVPVAGRPDRYDLRWFTPVTEVDLCGHATLAAAYVVFNCLPVAPAGDTVVFDSRSGPLPVRRTAGGFTLDFPTDRLIPTALPVELAAAFHLEPREVYAGREDYLLVFDAEADIAALAPDFRLLGTAAARGFIATAPGTEGTADFVSRCFYPAFGIDEDPVTGSAHTTLTPYWADRLGKTELTGVQLSTRRGTVYCRLLGERVELSGSAVLYLKGEIMMNDE
jgi:PhzF family phenazine biosynthesis protein